MKKKPGAPAPAAPAVSAAAGLRRRAEQQLQARPSASGPARIEADAQHLVHELQVHQLELEMQNAELAEARERAERLVEKYTDLYDFAPVGYFSLTANSTVQLVNLTGARLVGLERARLLGRPLGLQVDADFRPVFHAFLQRVFAGEGKQSCEVTLASAGQPPRTVSIEAERAPDRQECRAVMVDITERRQAADRVRLSEVRYRRLFEETHDGVILLNPGTRKITDANPFMTKLLGYRHDQLVGKELFEIGLLKDEVASQEMFQKLKRNREVRYEDLPLESQGGRHQEVEVVANLYQENGHSVIQCNIRDITARKLSEDILRRNAALFSALVEQAPVGVYVVDARFRVQQVNPKAQPVFRTVQRLIGRDLAEVLHILWPKQVADQVAQRFRHTLKTGESYQSSGFQERRQDTGVEESYEWQLQQVTLPAGERGVVCFFDNITERKRAEAAQRRVVALTAANESANREIVRRRAVEAALRKSEVTQRKLLEESHGLHAQLRYLTREIFLAQEVERKAISRQLHDEIAQTLAGITVQLATLTEAAAIVPRDLRKRIGNAQRLVGQSIDVVHRFARELRPAMLDDLGLIPALRSYIRDLPGRKRLRIRFTAFAGVEVLDNTRRTMLYRVAQEALTNVVRHAQAKRVTVRIQQVADSVRLVVRDDGKSFPADRLLAAAAPKRLGLHGMRERVELMGGDFAVDSAPGEGTAIRVTIPIRDHDRATNS